IVQRAGLDAARAAQVLAGGEFGAAVRAREQYYLDRGIHGVPAVIFDERSLVSGAQPVEVFERALRELVGGALPQ
ncbi:MAG: disulfide bond formation protein DsbA, partial [Dokdonella sp.]